MWEGKCYRTGEEAMRPTRHLAQGEAICPDSGPQLLLPWPAQGLNSGPSWGSAIPSHGPQLGLPGEGGTASLPACCLLEVIQLFGALCGVSGGVVVAICCKFELMRLAWMWLPPPSSLSPQPSHSVQTMTLPSCGNNAPFQSRRKTETLVGLLIRAF